MALLISCLCAVVGLSVLLSLYIFVSYLMYISRDDDDYLNHG